MTHFLFKGLPPKVVTYIKIHVRYLYSTRLFNYQEREDIIQDLVLFYLEFIKKRGIKIPDNVLFMAIKSKAMHLGRTRLRELQSGFLNNVTLDDNFFLRQISSSDLTQEQIENAIAKLQIVNIILDPSSDNPQSIFESLNSTGLDLSQSDLIRNYILMGLSNQEQTDLYNKKWMPTEKLFNYEKQSELMDRFFRDYITMKISRIPKEGNVYEEFKKYHQSLNITNMDHCDDTNPFIFLIGYILPECPNL